MQPSSPIEPALSALSNNDLSANNAPLSYNLQVPGVAGLGDASENMRGVAVYSTS
jgi:hypothetical protein